MPARVMYRGFRDIDETADVKLTAVEIAQWVNDALGSENSWIAFPLADGKGSVGIKAESIRGFLDLAD